VYLWVIRSRPTAYSKVTIQHNHLNRKNIPQNQKYKCKNNINFFYLNFIHCRPKLEKHKQSFLSENYEQTSPKKIIKKSHRSGRRGVIVPTHLGKARHVVRTRVLRRPIVFLRVRCSICFRCNILIVLIKVLVVAYPNVVHFKPTNVHVCGSVVILLHLPQTPASKYFGSHR